MQELRPLEYCLKSHIMKRTYKLYNIFLIFITCLFYFSNLQAQCIDNGNVWNKSWESCQVSASPNPNRGTTHWLLYEFDEAQNIDSTYIWNANKTGESQNGLKNVIIDYSVDGNTWTELGSFTFPQATELTDYEGFLGPNFGGVFIKKILITIVSTHGDGTCASIAELQFQVNKDACYGIIDVCGNCNGPGETIWYLDADNDGQGSINNTLSSCTQPSGYVNNADDYCDNGLPGWNEIRRIFEDNGCMGCHGNNASGGLNLNTYESVNQGGNKCGTNMLTGTTLVDIIMIDGYAGCGTPIGIPSMNQRVGGSMDNEELALLQSWIDAGAPEDCNCLAGAADTDNDGTCDAIDNCPGFDNTLIGLACNDGNDCTENDVWTTNCNCAGTPKTDSDNDGVCDVMDAAPTNSCTADGIIDGIEPNDWVMLPTNDCDNDYINNAGGDLSDFNACIDNVGQVNSVKCNCENNKLIAGGRFKGENGVGGLEEASDGMPDGRFTGNISGTNDDLTLTFPTMAVGDEICLTVSFSDPAGKLNLDVNFLSFTFLNETGLVDEAQEFCFEVLQPGPQEVVIRDEGSGVILLDGSTFEYCECAENDPKFNTPECQCNDNTLTEGGVFVSSIGMSLGENAASLPDSILSGFLGNNDSLILSYPNIIDEGEICIVMGFSDSLGFATIKVGDEQYFVPNRLHLVDYELQEFCFPISSTPAPEVLIMEIGSGGLKIDGSYYNYCTACLDVQLAVMLEGPFMETTGMMNTFQNSTLGLLPGQIPYNILVPPTPPGQPYNTTPWNYFGTEGNNWTNLDYTPDVVDWVLISFRTGIEKSTEVGRTAGLLKKDGSIFLPECGLRDTGLSEVYIVIEHRNHMGIMSPSPVPIVNGMLTYDFREADSFKDATSIGQIQLANGQWAMLGGDCDQTDFPSYDITGNDKTLWNLDNGQFNQYLNTDLNLDGDVNGADKLIWDKNNGFSSRVPK